MILENIRVLDFTQYLAGPTVTRLMAEMGAEIIKVEHGPDGDPARALPVCRDGRSGYFVQQNGGKKSLCLDLRKPESDAILKALVRHVDVVVENYGVGVMEKRGLDYASLAATNPRIIMASVSAFGRHSTLAHKTGYDWIAQAFSGLMFMTGTRDGEPLPVGVPVGDTTAGVSAFAALGYALYHRERTGRGQCIDLSMIDTLFHMHDISLQAHAITGGEFVPRRAGAHHRLVCPCGVFKGPQGHIVILVLQRQWPGLCEAMERPDLEHDPRFAEQDARAAHQQELIPIIEAWFAGFATDEQALARLDRHRVPSGPVLSPLQALDHEYFRDRGTIRTVDDPILGKVTVPGFPLRFSEQVDYPALPAPLLGQHNREVLRDLLGYAPDRIAHLVDTGVLLSART